jgi:integrase
MRACDLNTSGSVWIYTPSVRKNEHKGMERHVYLGPQAQEIIRPFLRTDLITYLFSPIDAMAEFWAERRRNRRSPMSPSQASRPRKTDPKKAPGRCYTTTGLRVAICVACQRAGIPCWHPHQLRHAAATRFRREHGLDMVQVLLGHSSIASTQIYAEADREAAIGIMAQIG